MYLVSITRLRVRSYFYLPLFFLHAFRSGAQAQKAYGLIAFDTRAEGGRVFWTRTLWTEEAAMKRYRSSGAHQIAMRLLSRICDEASYTRWTQDSSQPPTWTEIHSRLLAGGQLSKVKYPSAMHLAGKPAPDLAQEASL
jgi:hypothetical protein